MGKILVDQSSVFSHMCPPEILYFGSGLGQTWRKKPIRKKVYVMVV